MRLSKDGADAQTQLEVALVKAAAPEVDPSTKALFARLERLEGALAGAPRAQPAPAPTSAPSLAAPQPPAPEPAPAPVPPVPHPPEPEPAPTPSAPQPPPAAPQQQAPAAPGPAPAAPAPARAAAAGVQEPERQQASAVAVAEPEPPPAAAPPAAAPVGDLDLALVQELWPAVLQAVAETNKLLAACLAEARPIVVAGRDVTLAFTPDLGFQKKKAEDAAARQLLGAAFQRLTGVPPRLIFETRDAEELGAEPEVLGEDDFIARLRSEFDAVDHQPDQEDQEPA
jgi:DNA polymerase-3 subunit gamma/tau